MGDKIAIPSSRVASSPSTTPQRNILSNPNRVRRLLRRQRPHPQATLAEQSRGHGSGAANGGAGNFPA